MGPVTLPRGSFTLGRPVRRRSLVCVPVLAVGLLSLPACDASVTAAGDAADSLTIADAGTDGSVSLLDLRPCEPSSQSYYVCVLPPDDQPISEVDGQVVRVTEVSVHQAQGQPACYSLGFGAGGNPTSYVRVRTSDETGRAWVFELDAPGLEHQVAVGDELVVGAGERGCDICSPFAFLRLDRDGSLVALIAHDARAGGLSIDTGAPHCLVPKRSDPNGCEAVAHRTLLHFEGMDTDLAPDTETQVGDFSVTAVTFSNEPGLCNSSFEEPTSLAIAIVRR